MKWRKILQRTSSQTENSKTEATLCSDGISGEYSTLHYSHSTVRDAVYYLSSMVHSIVLYREIQFSTE